ncbi:MAG TPA: sugar ABC transporter permease [Thermomicrobiales bacterium]|nr:sugar ABC transporter permease [Thermomicrobiales bacterium]
MAVVSGSRQLLGKRGNARRSRVPGHASQMRFVAVSLVPILSLIAVFSLVPIGIVIWLSFLRYNQLAPTSPWIGLRNYEFAFQTDPFFRNALGNTLKYALVAVPANILISLPIALGLNQIQRLRALFRTAFFMPVVASAVAVSLLWTTIYDPQAGWLNGFLTQVGIAPRSWLADPNLAIWAVLVAAVWQDLGYNILVFLAGLQGIPNDFYDAAKVDGAGPWQRFRGITLPLLQRTTVFVLVLTMISYLQEFTHIQVMTDGGPIRSSETLVLYIYAKAFEDLQMGYAAAMSIVLMGIILVITIVQLRLLRTRWEY